MNPFQNTVALRGFLGQDVETPEASSFVTLLLATTSGMWDVATNEWKSRVDWHRVICPGPYFRGFTRGMRRGDYLAVEGELRSLEQERSIVIAGERFPVSHTTYAVHATRIERLDRHDWLVAPGDDG
jgi:single-stranded DNA-binding protein